MSASFWLDNSDDSIFFAPSSNLSSRSSADSFSIDNIPSLDNYPSLLLPSHSLDALPRCDLEPIKAPPCPQTTPRRRRTRHTFLSLMASIAFPKGNRFNRKYTNVLVSSPTPERLKNVPQLKPALKTWISGVPSSNPPDMSPWSPPRERPHYIWVPEGCFFPPSYLKHWLRKRHSPVDKRLPSIPVDSRLKVTSKPTEHPESSSRSLRLRRCASHITHHTMARLPESTPACIPITFPPGRVRGRPRRWSLSVPPSYISTEFIARRLESQRINNITGADSALSNAPVASTSPPLPAIKVSTSTTTIAISFPGSPEGPPPAPEPLAVRRGQKMLAPLTLHSPQRTDEEYPGIPTAFLGTPSAYPPHFQFTSSIAQLDAESLPIGDMINTLRSQADRLKVSTPVEVHHPVLELPHCSANSLSAASSDIIPSVSEDDWAFAHDLMLRFGDKPQDRAPVKAKHQQQAPSIRKSLTSRTRLAIQTNRMRRASVPAAATTPTNRPKSSSAPRTDLTKLGYSNGIARRRKDSRQTISNTGSMKDGHRSDSSSSPSPLSPITPSHTEALTDDSPNGSRRDMSAKRPPGILKHAKSVRFADMPKPDDAKDNVSSPSQPRRSTPKGTGGSPSLQPSPLRSCFVPDELDAYSPLKPDAVQATETVNMHDSIFNLPTISATPGLSNKSPSSSNSRAVKTLSLLVKDPGKDKENSPLALHTQRRARRNTAVDENSARRASRSEIGGRKHRLSSPLKSFLERLRA